MTSGLREFATLKLRRFEIPYLREFAISKHRRFEIPDLRTFATSELRRFKIPDLREFDIPENSFHEFHKPRRFEGDNLNSLTARTYHFNLWYIIVNMTPFAIGSS
jgi:hypothetical protein